MGIPGSAAPMWTGGAPPVTLLPRLQDLTGNDGIGDGAPGRIRGLLANQPIRGRGCTCRTNSKRRADAQTVEAKDGRTLPKAHVRQDSNPSNAVVRVRITGAPKHGELSGRSRARQDDRLFRKHGLTEAPPNRSEFAHLGATGETVRIQRGGRYPELFEPPGAFPFGVTTRIGSRR